MSFVNKSSTRFAPKVKPRGQLRRRSSALPSQQKQAIADALKETAKTMALSSASTSAISDTPTISENLDKSVAMPFPSTPASSQKSIGSSFPGKHSTVFESNDTNNKELNPPFLLTPALTQEPIVVLSPAPIAIASKPSIIENEPARNNRFSTIPDRKSNLITSQPRLTTVVNTPPPVRPQTPTIPTGDSRSSTPVPTSPRVTSSPSLSMPRLSSINTSSLRSPSTGKSPITLAGSKTGTPLPLLRSPKTVVGLSTTPAPKNNSSIEKSNDTTTRPVNNISDSPQTLSLSSIISIPNRANSSTPSTIPGNNNNNNNNNNNDNKHKPIINAFSIPSNVSVGQPVSSLRSSIRVAEPPTSLKSPISVSGPTASRGFGMRGGDEDDKRSSVIISSSIVTDQLGYGHDTKTKLTTSFEAVNSSLKRKASKADLITKANTISKVKVTAEATSDDSGDEAFASSSDDDMDDAVDVVVEAAAIAKASKAKVTVKRKASVAARKRVKKEEGSPTLDGTVASKPKRKSPNQKSTNVTDDSLPDTEKLPKVDHRIFEIGTHRDEHTYIITGDDITKLMKDRQRRSKSPTNHDKCIIDVESVTMAQLCGDLHIGKLSDNHSLVMTAREKRMKKKLYDKLNRDSRAGSVIGSRESSPAITSENIADTVKNGEAPGSDDEKKDPLMMMMNEDFIRKTPISVPSRQSNAVQLKIVDGRIEINADSLLVNRSVLAMETASATDKNVEEIMRFDKYVNSASYSKRERPERWDNDETSKFYKALSQWGTDFNLIAQLFPYRNRRQIKSKFKLEEKKNPLKIHLALVRKLPVDIDTYQIAGGSKIMDDPNDIEVEMEKIRSEHEEWLVKEKESIAEARKADSAAALKTEQAMFNMGPPKRQSKSEKIRLLRANQTIIGTVGDVKREFHELAF